MRISDWSSDVCSSDLRTTELFDGWLRIADQLQFARDPALLDSLAIGCEFVAFTTRCYGGESSFGGQHARFHRGVTALDARHIDEASRTADERPARAPEVPPWVREGGVQGKGMSVRGDLGGSGLV